MFRTSTAVAEHVAYTITKFGPDAPPPPPPPPGFRLWEKAIIGVAGLAVPSPAVACTVTGHAGWTAILMAAGITGIASVVVRHGLAEQKQPAPVPEPLVEIGWSDYSNVAVVPSTATVHAGSGR